MGKEFFTCEVYQSKKELLIKSMEDFERNFLEFKKTCGGFIGIKDMERLAESTKQQQQTNEYEARILDSFFEIYLGSVFVYCDFKKAKETTIELLKPRPVRDCKNCDKR